jgi:hypothetical protein
MTATLELVPTPAAAFPIPAGRGRWRFTLHARTFSQATGDCPTWRDTMLAQLDGARGRRLDQLWNQSAQAVFTLDGHDPAAALIQELGTELYAWRWDDTTGADVCFFRGVITQSEDQISEQAHVVTFTAWDYLKLLDRRRMAATVQTVMNAWDQDALADWAVRDSWYGGTYAPGSNLPLLVGMVDPAGAARLSSGVLRDRTYPGSSYYGQLFADLARVSGGFDYDVLPEPRTLGLGLANAYGPLPLGVDAVRVFYPRQGVTRTDMALVYGSNVSTVTRAVSSADYANNIRTLGNNGSANPAAAQLYADASNTDASGTVVGLWQDVQNAADVTIAATLSDQAAGALALEGVLTPTYTLGLRPGTYTPGSPNMGDTVPLVVQSGRLNVNTTVRVVGISYDIGDDGNTDVALTVGRPRVDLGQVLNATQRDVDALARR